MSFCRGQRIAGIYALAAGSVSQDLAPRKLKQNMPDPVAVIVLGRLAIDAADDAAEQGNGPGRAMLRDAVLRITAAAYEVGIAATLVHALNERTDRDPRARDGGGRDAASFERRLLRR